MLIIRELRIADPLCQIYYSKCVKISGNSGLNQPYMFEPQTDSEEELNRIEELNQIILMTDFGSGITTKLTFERLCK